MNRSTVGIGKSFYYEFLKKRQNKKAVYPRYTAPCLTKIYYFFITRFITSSFGSNGFWWVSFFKESLKTALLALCWGLLDSKKTLIECRMLFRVLNPLKRQVGVLASHQLPLLSFEVLRYRMSHEPLCNTNIVGQKNERARTFQCFFYDSIITLFIFFFNRKRLNFES